MKNKILPAICFLISTTIYQTVIAQKPTICLTEKLIKTTSFDTNTFHRGCAPMDNGTCLWDNGKTIYIKFLNGSKLLQEKTKSMAKQWEQYANMHIQFVDEGLSNIRIKFTEDGYIYSALGTYSNMFAQNEVTMIVDTSDIANLQGNVLHLFGHALGLQDEIYVPQSKTNWNMGNLDKFFIPSKPEIEKQIFINKYVSNFANAIKYDELSIMLAPVPSIYAKAKTVLQWNTTISETDKKVIGILYPRTETDSKTANIKPIINLFYLKITKNGGFSFFPILDFNNAGSRKYVYFSIVLVNKNGEPIRTVDEEYNMNKQVGTFIEPLFMQGSFNGINKKRLSDVQFFIPQSVFNKIEVSKGIFAVFKAFYFDRDTDRIEWLYISKPFEVKL